MIVPRTRRVAPVPMTSLPDAFRLAAATVLPRCQTTFSTGWGLHGLAPQLMVTVGTAELAAYQTRPGTTEIEVSTPPVMVQAADWLPPLLDPPLTVTEQAPERALLPSRTWMAAT